MEKGRSLRPRKASRDPIVGVLEGLIAILPIFLLVAVPALLAVRRILRRRRRGAKSPSGGSARRAGDGGRVGEAAKVPGEAGRQTGAWSEAPGTPWSRPEGGAPPWARPENAVAPRGGAAGPVSVQGAVTAGDPAAAGMSRPVPRQEGAAAALASEATGAADSRREGYVYPPPLHLRRLSAAGAGSRRELQPAGAAVVAAVSLRASGPTLHRGAERPGAGMRAWQSGTPLARSAAQRGPGIWRRLEGLPPLQRAIVLMEILGPPRGASPAKPGWPADPGG